MSDKAEDRDVEIWAEVLKDLMYRVPSGKRAAVLAKVAQHETERRERARTGPILMSSTDFADRESAGIKYWHEILHAKSIVIAAFVRDITNNNHCDTSAGILFQKHRGPGSGYLSDYLENVTGTASTLVLRGGLC